MFFTILGMILLCIIGGYFIAMGILMIIAGKFFGMSPISCDTWIFILIVLTIGVTIIAYTFVYSPLTLSMG